MNTKRNLYGRQSPHFNDECRTKNDYKERQIAESPFIHMEGVDLKRDVNLEYMHMPYLGVMKKLLFLWARERNHKYSLISTFPK